MLYRQAVLGQSQASHESIALEEQILRNEKLRKEIERQDRESAAEIARKDKEVEAAIALNRYKLELEMGIHRK